MTSEAGDLQIFLGPLLITKNILTGQGQVNIDASALPSGRYSSQLILTDGAGNRTIQTFNVIINTDVPNLELTSFPTELNNETVTTFSYYLGNTLYDMTNLALDLYLEDADAPPFPLGTGYTPYQIITFDENLFERVLVQNGAYSLLLKLNIKGQLALEQSNVINVALYPAQIELSDFGPLSLNVKDGRFESLKEATIELLGVSGNQLATLLNTSNLNVGEHLISLPDTLPDGIYRLSVDIVSWGGKHTRKTSSYIVDHTLPTLKDVILLGNPNNFNQPLELQLALSDPLPFRDIALFLMGTCVVSQNTIINPSACVLTFNALVSGEKLPDGHYPLEIKVSDVAGNTTVQTISLDIDTLVPIIISSSLEPTLFAPGNDDTAQATWFSLTSNEPVRAKLWVFDTANTLIRTIQEASFSCFIQLDWDGYTKDYVVKDGRYRLVLELTDAAGNVTRSSPNTVEIVRSRQTLSGLRLSQTKISSGKMLTIQFVNAITGNLKTSVYNLEGVCIKTLLSGNVCVGDNTLTWNTLSEGGTPLAEGDYVIVFSFSSLDKSTQKTFKLSLSIDNTPPTIYNFALNSSYFLRNTATNLQVSFKLFEPVSYNIGLFSSNRVFIEPLQRGHIESGLHTISLETISSNLGVGVYFIGTKFTDEVGNEARSFATLNIINTITTDILSDKSLYIFTPDGDAINETITPKLSLSGVGSKTVLVRVKTDTGKDVITLARLDHYSPIEVDCEWNGKNAEGLTSPEGLYHLIAYEKDEWGNEKTIDIPIALITQKIKLQTQDNGSTFSFNHDGRQDVLNYGLRLIYPEPLTELSGYKMGADLHIQVWQADTLLSEKTVQLIDKYEGTLEDSLVPHEGPFSLKFMGEDQNRIAIEITTLNYLNDLTPPQAGTLDALIESSLMITDTTDPRLSIKSLFRVCTVDAIVEGEGSATAYVYSEKGLLFTASANKGVFYLRQIVGTEGLNQLNYQLIDNAGNIAPTQSVAYTIDLTPPAIVSVNVGKYFKVGSYTITVNFSEPLASVPNLSLLMNSNHLESWSGKTGQCVKWKTALN